jgi:hypothetical protein
VAELGAARAAQVPPQHQSVDYHRRLQWQPELEVEVVGGSVSYPVPR